ncbi:MAG: amidohydrolase family protein [Kiritimatiellae bacterium]|nr:amidohydrolase family protein [Kiritimatiellia bacterium]
MKNLSLFNVNGHIGRGAYEEPQFPTAASFAAHLDYLGIDRSLVWHVAARDLNPMLGNRRLLQEIAEAGLEQRLLPTFIVTPACFFENGISDFLRAQFGAGRVRALRITPDMSRFPIREIERVLSELAQFKPALFWDCRHGHDELDIRDMEHLARTFPQISFVITQKMWGGFGSVLDLMWRCPNVYVDTSWLHMRDTIELLTENFGATRVLFGIGYKSHYGAAIAALMHARLDDAQRDEIAHGNIERLLKLDPLTGKITRPPALLQQKPLWNVLREGKPIKDVEIIDAHGHSPPHTRGWVIRQQDYQSGIAALIAQMDRLGVRRLILSPEAALFGENYRGNREVEDILLKHGDRFSGYLVFNPLYAGEMIPRLDEFFQRGFFVGFKLLPSYWKIPATDPRYQPVWEHADRHQRPILLHTWDDKYNSPALLKDIVMQYPHATFILGHSGGGTAGRLEAEALAQAHPNVYLEFCGTFTTPRPFETSLQLVGKNRVLFGSDTAAHDQAWELGRYLSMPLPDADLIPGLGANMRKILENAGMAK